ncbi:MAG: hypothetical protein NVSMB49_24860 [Ktedonobacteraceae bacterium]
MEHLRIYFFGTFRFYRDDVLLTSKDWQIRHARQLFKLLFTERGRTVSADRVVDLLWPYSAEHAHKTLRAAVSILRTVLEPTREPQGPSRFVPRGCTGYTLQLPDDKSVWVDTIEFERLLGEANVGHESPKKRRILESALQLYMGDYLAEDEQECWAITERTRLRERYFTNVLALMEAQRKLGCYNEAITVGRHALTIDVCREPLYPIIMHCQAMLGDTVGALQTFEQCRQELNNQLGIDPSPQTLALHTELLQGEFCTNFTKSSQMIVKQNTRSSSKNSSVLALSSAQYKDTPEPFVQEPLLVTYKEHFTWISRQLRFLKEERTQVRGPRIIACLGEMGVGKSFFLRNIRQYAQKLQISVLTTTCEAIELGIAFAPFTAMMKAWLGELRNEELNTLPRPALATLAHVLPELLTRIPTLVPTAFLFAEHIHSALITAFVDVISELSAQHPLIITIDDLQWVDEASLVVLHRLAHLVISTGSEGRSLLMVLAYRPEDVLENMPLNTTLLSLRRNAFFHELHLRRFSVDEVEAYVYDHDTTHVLSTEQIYQVTQGNALFLTEAVRMLQHPQDHSPLVQNLHMNNAVMNALLHSQSLQDAVLVRIARLPQRAIELLEYAAVIGRPFPPALLCSCLSTEDYKMLDMLLARHFFLEIDGKDHETYLAFAHEVVAQIVYTNCSAIKRSQLHRYIAEQLTCYYAETAYAHGTEIAAHYRFAGPQYQTQAWHYETQVENHLPHVNKRICQ